MSRAYRTRGEEARCIKGIGRKPRGTGRSYLEDPDVDGRMILKWIFEKGDMRA
jgi:hypothetical protein